MAVKEIRGNIFATKAQTIVNTVNCVGVMGAGIALEFRLREPDMYQRYVSLCKAGKLTPGTLWLYEARDRLVLNFPTKRDWKHPSRREYLERGLEKFADTYQAKGITSIAFPHLGADKGGIPVEVSREIMLSYLSDLPDLEVEIYEHDPTAPDDLYSVIRRFILSHRTSRVAALSGIERHRLETITKAMQSDDVCQVNQLGKLPGIGASTLEKLFSLHKLAENDLDQYPLFSST